jgi:hypothetical protein
MQYGRTDDKAPDPAPEDATLQMFHVSQVAEGMRRRFECY